MNTSSESGVPWSSFVIGLVRTFIVRAAVGNVFDLMMKVMTALIVVIAIVFSVLSGWMVKRMMSDDIKREFVAP